MVKIISFSLITKEDVQEIVDKSLTKAFDVFAKTTMTEAIKGAMDEQRKEYERYMGALMEDANRKFDILAENLASQMDRLRENDIMLGRHSDAMTQSDFRLRALEVQWKNRVRRA